MHRKVGGAALGKGMHEKKKETRRFRRKICFYGEGNT